MAWAVEPRSKAASIDIIDSSVGDAAQRAGLKGVGPVGGGGADGQVEGGKAVHAGRGPAGRDGAGRAPGATGRQRLWRWGGWGAGVIR